MRAPDKRNRFCPVFYPAFFVFYGGQSYGPDQWKNQTRLPEVPVRRVRQRHDHLGGSIVDMAMVGRYQGPSGLAALAVVAPVWNIIYSLGLLMGIGGSVISAPSAAERAENRGGKRILHGFCHRFPALAALAWLGILFFAGPSCSFSVRTAACSPSRRPIWSRSKPCCRSSCSTRCSPRSCATTATPGLATGGVLAGGLFNVAGDYFFVFTLDMGVYGRGPRHGDRLRPHLPRDAHALFSKKTR